MNPAMIIGFAAFVFLVISGLDSGWIPLIGGYKLVAGNISPLVFFLNITASAGMGAASAAFLVSLWGAGERIGDWLFQPGGRGSRMRGAALGIMLASLMVMGLGLAGLLNRPLLVLVFPAFLACAPWRRIVVPAGRGWKTFGPALLLLPLLSDILVAPLLPPVNVDMLVYHLGVPELWRMAHRIYAYPGNMTFSYPMGLERLYLPLQAMGMSGANAWLHLLLLALSAALVAGVLRELGSPHARAFGWLAFGSSASLYLAMQGHQDIGMVFAVALAMRAVVRGSMADLATAGALLPFLKYTGLEYSATFALAWLVLGVGRAGRKLAVIVLLGALVPSLPWLARNWLDTGNPLYPFFHHLLPSLNWRDWNSGMLWFIMRNATVQPDFTGPLGMAGGWLAYFWRAGGSQWFSWHTALFCLVPVAMLARGIPRAGRVLALQALLFAVLFLAPAPKVGRYLLPGSLVPLALCALLIKGVPRPAVWGLVAVILPLNALAVAGQARTGAVTPDEVLGGSVNPAAWWRVSMGSFAGTAEYINRECAGRGRVLVVGEPSGMGLNRPWLATDDTNIPAWRLALGDSPDPVRMRIRLRQADIRWVLYNPLRASRLANWAEAGLVGVPWMRAWARAWKAGTRLQRAPERFDWTGGVYVYEVLSGLVKAPVGPLPWLPGAERYLILPTSIEQKRVDPAALANQYSVLDGFGVASYSRMLVAEFIHQDRAEVRREYRAAEARGFRTPFLYESMAEIERRDGRICEALKCIEKAVDLTSGDDQRLIEAMARLKVECPGGR